MPNYNGKLLLQQTIPPLLKALKNSNIVYEIIISDDCSTDDSVSYLQEFYKELIVIKSQTNSGFSITINKGIFIAKLSHVLLLNSDVILSKDYFNFLIRYFDKPETFGVMGRIIGWDNDTIQDGGKYPYMQGAKIKTSGNYIPLDPKPGDWLYSMYLSGANALIDRNKIVELNGFDEIFSPFYVEDYELSLRAWRLGWKCYYEHEAICRHKISASIKSSSTKKKIAIIYNRNKMFLHAIHLSGFTKMFWYLQLAFEALIYIITLRWYYLKSMQLFFKNKKAVSQSRQAFESIQHKHGKEKSVKDVLNQITDSLLLSRIKRF